MDQLNPIYSAFQSIQQHVFVIGQLKKVDKLEKPQASVQCRRPVKVITSIEDAGLLNFQAKPGAESVNPAKRVSANAKSKSTIIFCLGDSTLAKTTDIVHSIGTLLSF